MRKLYTSFFTLFLFLTCSVALGQDHTFNYTGSVQVWTVPPGVTSIMVEAWGAQGGSTGPTWGVYSGGKGGYVKGNIAVTPGSVLYINVGQQGQATDAANAGYSSNAFNGGGKGWTWNNHYGAAGGGGGATDIRFGNNNLASRVLVAGGGGGATSNGSIGGAGGGLTGGVGSGGSATGGTQTAGGTGGFSGGLGYGGDAQEPTSQGWVGGGGGGYYGGASGISHQSGAGGSSYYGGITGYVPTSTTTTANQRSGNGLLTITYLFSGGTVTTDQTFCGIGTPTLFASTAPASGATVAGYQWQTSTDNNNWSDINDATELTYQAPEVSQKTYFRRKATATDASIAYSNTITIDVNPIPTFDPSSFGASICNNQSTTIDLATGGSIVGATYNWVNDNTAIGLAASGNGTITFTTTNTGATTISGNITVTPTAAGCPGTPQTFTLAVKPTPTVTAVADQEVCHDKNTSAISFTGAVASTTYSWTNSDPSIGLAASGTGDIAAFTAVNNGNAPVTATITVTPEADGCPGVAQTFTITVNQLPTATISGGSFCQTGSQQLTVTGQAGGTFSTTAGLTISASGLIDLAASTPGTYTVTYTFSNGTCSNTTTSSVTVNPLPQATISGTAVVCQSATPPSITFTGSNGTAPYTFTYKVNGGADQVVTTTSGNTYTLVVPTGVPGTYVYSLVSVKDASSTTCEKAVTGIATLTVTPTPSASFSYGGTPYCATGTATPTFTGTIGGTYSATAGLNINTTTGVINLTASVPGTYTVTYTVAAAGGCDEYTTTTSVTVKALTTITTAPAAQTVCERSPVSMSVVASGEGTLQYQWRKNGVNITGATAATYTIASVSTLDAASYDVVVTGNCGSVTSAAAVLTVNVIPVTPGITTNGSTTFCQGGSVVLTSSANSGNQWFKDGVAINGATAQSYTVTTSGNYTVRTTRNNCTSEFAGAATVTVKALPAVPVISATGNILTSSSANNNQWYLNGRAIAGATGTSHRVQSAGLYTVQVTENGCISTSAAHNFVTTRIDNPAMWNGEVTAYPNPVQKTLFIKNTTGQKLQVQLYDAFGKKVYEAKLTTNEAAISMEKWASGVYQLVLTNLQRNETISQTIIKL